MLPVAAFWTSLGLNYNTSVVLLGTILIGFTSGMLGVFLLLRRRALIGDAIAHATLPGVAIAFLWLALNNMEKSLPTLFLGAAISGGLGGATVLAFRHWLNIREDAALGIVLSVFFGAGIAFRKIVQEQSGNSSGLDSFIYGKAASIGSDDVWSAAIAGIIVVSMLLLFVKELKLLCFDAELAASQGFPVLLLDALLITMVVVVTMIGLQAVGTILIIALLVIPAASARFWTNQLSIMLAISSTFGAASCAAGTLLSASYDKLPSGATIVLTACSFFMISFVFGIKRGTLWRTLRVWQMRRDHDFLHVLRSIYELLEVRHALPDKVTGELRSTLAVTLQEVARQRGWHEAKVRQLAQRMAVSGLVVFDDEDRLQLTPRGILRALNSVRDHRLLELYMVEEAEADVSQADREADYLEHGLEPEHLAELAEKLDDSSASTPPPSLHDFDSSRDSAE